MKKKYLKKVLITHKPTSIPLLQKIFSLHFKLGFSPLTNKKTTYLSRKKFLQSSFTARTKEENTRTPINTEMLWALPPSYSFLVISDIHLKKEDTRFLENLQHACIKGDAFLVVTGDITAQGNREELNIFLNIMQKLPIPCFPVIGNHDIYKKNWATWQELIGETVYRIDKGSTTLIMLDSANGFLGKNQLEWLEQQLKTSLKTTFIFSHCNFFIPRKTVLQQFANLSERQKVITLCKNKVSAVFTGHSHKKYTHIANEVVFINIEDFRDKGTYCRVNVSKNKIQYSSASIADIIHT